MTSSIKSPIILALDVASSDQALALADQFDPQLCRLKVGKELFTRCGPDILKALHQRGFEIFLDLKFHDIPNTCAQAVWAAADQGVWMVNLHASGGLKMMEAAQSLLHQHRLPTLLVAVTVLTSMDAQTLAEEVGVKRPLEAQVEALALNAKKAGLAGVVCSGQEVERLGRSLGADFLKVTPGIRLAHQPLDDQQRIMTPKEAMQAGSTHLVIGRALTRAAAPQQALDEVLKQVFGSGHP